MPDLSTREQIRAEAVAVMSEALNAAPEKDWVDLEAIADALAAAGLLPTAMEGRFIGRGMLRRTRYVTDWREPEEAHRD